MLAYIFFLFCCNTLVLLCLVSIEEIKNAIECKKSDFILKFKELNNNPEFISAVSDTTKSPIKVVARFSLFADILKEFYSSKIPTLELQDNKISLIYIGG